MPKSLYVEDITIRSLENKDLLVNRAYRNFWGKEGVYLAVANPTIEEDNLKTFHEIGRRIKYKFLGFGKQGS